jgi:hypothetical protein
MPLDQAAPEYVALRVLLDASELARLDDFYDTPRTADDELHTVLTTPQAIETEAMSVSERTRLLLAWMIYTGDHVSLSHEDFLSQDARHLERILRALALSCGWRVYGISLFGGRD